jgi:glycine/serine hydroxymethyltransferase
LCWHAGTPAMTSRGLSEKDFETVAGFLHEVCEVSHASGSSPVMTVMHVSGSTMRDMVRCVV